MHESGEHKVHYCASKAAVGSLTKGLALELARHGIRVNAVEPGAVDTLIVKDGYLEDFLESMQDDPGLPINRVASGDDMVGAALFLCSEAASYMTGASILVDGGGFAGAQLPEHVLRAYERSSFRPRVGVRPDALPRLLARRQTRRTWSKIAEMSQ